MAYETDEARDAARQRLQARMERRGTPRSASPAKRVSPRSEARSTTRVSVESLNAKAPWHGAASAIPSIPPIAVIAAGIMVALAFVVIAVTQCARIAPADATELIAADGAQAPIVTIDKNNEAQRKLIDLIPRREHRHRRPLDCRAPRRVRLRRPRGASQNALAGR